MSVYLSEIKNCLTVKSENESAAECEFVTKLLPQIVIVQYAIKVKNNLIYYIDIKNNSQCDICNIKVEDTLPLGTLFVSTFIENGKYQYHKNKLFYDIGILKFNSSCEIIITLKSIAIGEKNNLIEVSLSGYEYPIRNLYKVFVYAL